MFFFLLFPVILFTLRRLRFVLSPFVAASDFHHALKLTVYDAVLFSYLTPFHTLLPPPQTSPSFIYIFIPITCTNVCLLVANILHFSLFVFLHCKFKTDGFKT